MAVQVDRSLRLPKFAYFAAPQAKSGIALHHTVCGSARITLALWRAALGKRKRIGTAFVIDRDGTIYEAFDPACWAWQFGLPWPDRERRRFEKRFIGIEITSEGGLTEHKGKLYPYDRHVPGVRAKPKDQAMDCGTEYRGYRWFDRYKPEQLAALGTLVDELCTRFAIPRVHPAKPFLYYGEALRSFQGVIGHAMVRSDKSDPAPDPRLWATLETMAGLRPAALSAPPAATAGGARINGMNKLAIATWNAVRLNRMHVAAGSLVKTLLKELERRHVYLMLKTPSPDGHTIGYSVEQGDAAQVAPLARALGFKTVTDRRLEVRGA